MNNFHSRTAALLGEAATEKLKNARVALFGIGGVGSFVLEALVRSGIGSIDIFDCDTVEESNLNRQLIATRDTLGLSKTRAAINRAKEINPEIKIQGFDIFYGAETAESTDLSVYDFIIDAIDSVSSKTELILRADSLKIPIISSMGTGNKLDPTRIRIDDIYKTSVCPLARAMRTELKKKGIKHLPVAWSDETPVNAKTGSEKADGKSAPASMIFVPAAAGLAIASFVVKELIK
ncbi:MAG: tRNA threonylcarbamoyladenosine dehydratase [Clostridiales bacterium]|nr:tRNA threonylcarbamoyladenosine dehydratase [Candidatus Equinaster intestinalis]